MLGYVGVRLGYVWGLSKNDGVTRAGVGEGGRFFFLILKLKFLSFPFLINNT